MIGSPEDAVRLRSEIEQAALAIGVTGRVCGDGCTVTCRSCGAVACQCSCSPDCPDAPQALSSDPDAYPIEPGIVPLVFALTRTGLFAPCWSCEGHLRPDGSLWKLPSVWFNCDAMAHVRLLADGLGRLAHIGRLATTWRVVVTYSDPDNPHTTFALEPLPDTDATLQQLRRDANEIANALPALIVEGGQALRRSI
jgi:hypothetical protein